MKTRHRRRQSFDPGRLLAGCAVSFGALALVLSVYNPITGATEPESSFARDFVIEELPELEEQAQPAQLIAASVTDEVSGAEPSRLEPVRSPTPLPKQAPPLDALPASRVRSVGVSNGVRSPSSQQTATYSGPLSVALVTLDGAPALADDVAGRLRANGHEVRQTSLDQAERPDVLLLLDASGLRTQALYCDPGAAGSATLARLLLAAVSPVAPSSGADGASISCAEVHAGRAQTAAVLLELSLDQAEGGDTPASVAAAVERYLDDNATALRSVRGRTMLSWPAGGPITSHFGTDHPLGIDIGQWDGNIVAAVDGRVVFAGGDSCCSYGLYVVVESPGGLHTLYAHLSRIEVKKGQSVRRGQALGPVGCSGHCYGNHLHFEVFLNGARVNPMLYLP